MFTPVDQSSGVPAYRQVEEQILANIGSGALSPGDSLPTVRQLATVMKTSPTTIQRAYDALRDSGRIQQSVIGGGMVAAAVPVEEVDRLRPAPRRVFWSYAHEDDKRTRGSVQKIIMAIEDEYQVMTGTPLDAFLDKENISWGDRWREVIDASILDTVFFVPILSPTYLRRPACLEEFRKASAVFRESGNAGCILPIIFAPIEATLASFPDDDMANLIKDTQYMDLRMVRRLSSDDPRFAAAIGDIVDQMLCVESAMKELHAHDADVWAKVSRSDDQEGPLDRAVEIERVPIEMVETLQGLTDALDEFSTLADATADELLASDLAGRGLSGRLEILSRTSSDFSEPAQRISTLCVDFTKQTERLDTGLSAYFNELSYDADDPNVVEMREVIRKMCESTRRTFGYVEQFSEALKVTEGLSRMIRPPIAKIRASLTLFLSTSAYFEDWERLYVT